MISDNDSLFNLLYFYEFPLNFSGVMIEPDMKYPENSDSLSAFWADLAESVCPVLLLDYDGTLAPFRMERDQAFPYPGVVELLSNIRNETTTRLVIISGRAIDDLLPLLGLEPAPEIWGCHGWERLLADGTRPPLGLPSQAMAGLNAAEGWCIAQGLSDSLERKPASVAIHWRGQSESDAARLSRKVEDGWQSLANESDLEIHRFNGGLELRCPGKDKGTALLEILNGLKADVPAAFLGDDLTDEDGFKAIRSRGLGVLVQQQERATLAHVRINPPEELLAFLETWYRTAPASEEDA